MPLQVVAGFFESFRPTSASGVRPVNGLGAIGDSVARLKKNGGKVTQVWVELVIDW
jgi:hypothetical protein